MTPRSLFAGALFGGALFGGALYQTGEAPPPSAGGWVVGELRAGPLVGGTLDAFPGEAGSVGFELYGSLTTGPAVIGEFSFLQAYQP
jgi:hypothetical protein